MTGSIYEKQKDGKGSLTINRVGEKFTSKTHRGLSALEIGALPALFPIVRSSQCHIKYTSSHCNEKKNHLKANAYANN